jgi:serine/threonine protein phosphatase PrpC
MVRSVELETAAFSHTGLIRSQNEDSLLVRPEKRLFAVADGMGGHVAGEIASALAVAALDEAITDGPSADSPQGLAHRLLAGVRNANERILEHGRTEPETRGMGTTLTAIAFPNGGTSCALAHVGDSRAYRFRGGQLELLTRDHTWVQDQVDAGHLDPEQARAHPYANVLSRVLGLPVLDLVESAIIDVQPRDLLLLCSDGLTAMLEEENIQAILLAQPDLQAAAAELIEAANAGGGVDNITVILVRAAGTT